MLRQKTRKFRLKISKQLSLSFILIFLAVLIIMPLTKRVNNKSNVDKEIDLLKIEIAKAESKNSELKKMVEYLESDGFLEEQARLNFNLKKDGENVVMIKDTPTGTSNIASTTTPEAEQSNLSKWIDYFFSAK